jgi:sterol desaturase/sphingolipid hydroxylase (fatty acid hydroxylase superfamily)
MLSEALLRALIAGGLLAGLLLWEALAPLRRRGALRRVDRWPGAVALLAVGVVLSRLLAPAGLAGLALWAEARGWGLGRALGVPEFAWGLACLVLLDLAVWGQHWASHRWGWLWRLHRVHHADPDIDLSTAVRFHPLELAVSLGWKAAIVVVLGAPAWAVLAFEVVLNATALFNHANIRLPGWLERPLGWVIVTPRQHRVHHSLAGPDLNHNFGFCLNLWDRLAGVFRPDPEPGLACARYGLTTARDAAAQGPLALLTQPWRTDLPGSG